MLSMQNDDYLISGPAISSDLILSSHADRAPLPVHRESAWLIPTLNMQLGEISR